MSDAEGEQDGPLAPDVDAEVGRGLLAEQQAVDRPGAQPDGHGPDQRRSAPPRRAGPRTTRRSRRAGTRRSGRAPSPTGTSPSPGRRPGATRRRSPSAAGWSAARGRRSATAGRPCRPRSAPRRRRSRGAGRTAGSTIRTGMRTAIAAPSAAPDAVPSTYGSASGLRSSPWNVAPATARPMPTTIAVRTRGSRRSMTIVSVAGGPGTTGKVQAEQPVGQDADGVARRDRHRAEAHAQDERHREGAADRLSTSSQRAGRAAPADRWTSRTGRSDGSRAGGHGAALRSATGRGEGTTAVRMDRQRELAQALDQPRSGTGHDEVVDAAGYRPFLTAVMTPQPGRAATASAVTP